MSSNTDEIALRRKLLHIFSLMTPLNNMNDREILLGQLHDLLAELDTSDEALGALPQECIAEVSRGDEALSEYLTDEYFATLFHSKYERISNGTVTALMSVGTVFTSLFNGTASELSGKACLAIARALKKHYLNPHAEVHVLGWLFPSLDLFMQRPQHVADLVDTLAKSPSQLNSSEKLFNLAWSLRDDQGSLEKEEYRSFGFYPRRILFSVSVPLGEMIVTRPYHHPSGGAETKTAAGSPKRAATWEDALTEALSEVRNDCVVHVTEPAPVIPGSRLFEQATLPFRVQSMLAHATTITGTAPEDLVVSIARFSAPPPLDEEYFDEVRISIALKASPKQPFSSDRISLLFPEDYEVLTQNLAGLFEEERLARVAVQPGTFPFEHDEASPLTTDIDGALCTTVDPKDLTVVRVSHFLS